MVVDTLSALGPFAALVGAFFVVGLIILLAAYIYGALVLMTIGKKLNIGPTWLAWIPIVNMFYLAMLASYKWYYGFLFLLAFIPFIGMFVTLALTIWWWWRVAEARKKPGWWGILMIVPIVNWIFMGLIAWQD